MNRYQEIEIQRFSTAVRENNYLICYADKYFEVNSLVADLIQTLQSHENEDDGTTDFCKKKEGKYSKEYIKEVIKRTILPILERKHFEKEQMFIYQKELFTSSAIDKLSDVCRFLFKKNCLIFVFLLAMLLDILFITTTEDLLEFNNQITVYTVMGLLLFIVSSSFFHEIGHASACKHYGIKHGGVGFGLYLNIPVLYTDVTGIWRLNRLQRCVVNLAGVYFQCFIMLFLMVLFYLTKADILRYMLLTMNLGFIMTLNPFFKFDGYWIASDLMGIPNLKVRAKEYFYYLYARIRKSEIPGKPYFLQISRKSRYFFLGYAILVNLFLGYYFFYIIPMFIYNFACSFPDEVEQLILYLSNNMAPPFALLRNIGMQLIFLGLISYFLANLLRPIIKRYFRHA